MCMKDRMNMKAILLTVAGILITGAVALAESAHKGYTAYPWPSSEGNRKGFRPEFRGSTYQPLPFREFRLTGPWARIDQPDPPTNSTFKGEFWFKMDCTVTVQRVYMILPQEDGTVTNREIKTSPLSFFNKEVISGYYAASFTTEAITFKEGDVFLIIFRINGEQMMAFLRVLYTPFLPS